jgi:hypothetical protein
MAIQPKPKVSLLLALSAAWLPIEWAAQPLQRVVTTVHEVGHSAAVVATGGRVLSLSQQGTTGHMSADGGWPLVVYLSGYLLPLILLGLSLGWLKTRRWSFWGVAALWVTAVCDLLADAVGSVGTAGDLSQLAHFSQGMQWPWVVCLLTIAAATVVAGGLSRRATRPTRRPTHPRRSKTESH